MPVTETSILDISKVVEIGPVYVFSMDEPQLLDDGSGNWVRVLRVFGPPQASGQAYGPLFFTLRLVAPERARLQTIVGPLPV